MTGAALRILQSRWLLQVVATVGFVALGLWLIDLPEALSRLRAIDLRWLAPGIAVYTLARYMDSYRWRFLLRDILHAPQRVLFAAFVMGNMLNSFLPFRAGDIAKVQVLGRRYRVPRAGVAGSVFIAQAPLDAAALVALLLLSLLLIGPVTLPVEPGLVLLVALGGLMALAIAVALSRNIDRIALLAARLPVADRRIAGLIEEMGSGLYALRGTRRIAVAVALSFPVWLLEAAMFALFGEAHGLDAPPSAYLLAVAVANIVTALPITIWNLGTYEAAVVASLGLAGVGGADAVAYALTVHLASIAWTSVMGLSAIWYLGLAPQELLSLRPPRDDATARGRQASGESDGRQSVGEGVGPPGDGCA